VIFNWRLWAQLSSYEKDKVCNISFFCENCGWNLLFLWILKMKKRNNFNVFRLMNNLIKFYWYCDSSIIYLKTIFKCKAARFRIHRLIIASTWLCLPSWYSVMHTVYRLLQLPHSNRLQSHLRPLLLLCLAVSQRRSCS
jgi:hypothetical protein